MIAKRSQTTIHALTATALALVGPAAAAAQTSLTVAGGLNLASMTVETEGLSISPESVTRLVIGASLEIPMSDRFGLHLGGAYSQKGFGIEGLGATAATEIDYLEFTALGGTPFSVSDRASLHLLAGPALAFKLSCGVSASYMGEDLSEDCGDDGPKSMDLGLMGGARLEFGVSERMGLSVGALYNLGLTNMVDSDDEGSIKSRVLTLQAGIVYSIG